MNYTKNYRLPQWVKSDRIMMDDFNAAMASMENGMTASTATANTAKQTADTAKQTADSATAAATAAQAKADKLPYVVGIYTGTGKEQDIILGFTPSLVIAFRSANSNDSDTTVSQFAAAGQAVAAGKFKIIENGFRLAMEDHSYRYPALNNPSFTYQYIAFK